MNQITTSQKYSGVAGFFGIVTLAFLVLENQGVGDFSLPGLLSMVFTILAGVISGLTYTDEKNKEFENIARISEKRHALLFFGMIVWGFAATYLANHAGQLSTSLYVSLGVGLLIVGWFFLTAMRINSIYFGFHAVKATMRLEKTDRNKTLIVLVAAIALGIAGAYLL